MKFSLPNIIKGIFINNSDTIPDNLAANQDRQHKNHTIVLLTDFHTAQALTVHDQAVVASGNRDCARVEQQAFCAGGDRTGRRETSRV
jgi:hypothetical protein